MYENETSRLLLSESRSTFFFTLYFSKKLPLTQQYNMLIINYWNLRVSLPLFVRSTCPDDSGVNCFGMQWKSNLYQEHNNLGKLDSYVILITW